MHLAPCTFTFVSPVKKIIIAIDGYSACGKSSTAKQVANILNYIHIDSGAMYRAVALYFLRHQIPIDHDSPELQAALPNIKLEFEFNTKTNRSELFMDGENVEDEIRGNAVSAIVSEVSTIKTVRKAMVAQQRLMAQSKGIVMEGRDIGTVVFPHAELKIFMTASVEKRIQRRVLELKIKGMELTVEQVRENVMHRDHIDTTRKESPLRKADDAIVLDNTHMSVQQQIDFVLDYADKVIHHNFVPNAQG